MQTLMEVTQHLVSRGYILRTLVARGVAEVSEEQITGGDYLVGGSVLEVVYRIFSRRGTPQVTLVRVEVLRIQTRLMQLIQQIEVMYIHLGALGLILMLQKVIDAVGGHGGLTDSSSQQVWANDVAGDKVTGLARHLVELVGIDQTALIGQRFEAGHISTLTDSGYDQIRFQDPLGALGRDRGHAVHGAVAYLQSGGTAIIP